MKNKEYTFLKLIKRTYLKEDINNDIVPYGGIAPYNNTITKKNNSTVRKPTKKKRDIIIDADYEKIEPSQSPEDVNIGNNGNDGNNGDNGNNGNDGDNNNSNNNEAPIDYFSDELKRSTNYKKRLTQYIKQSQHNQTILGKHGKKFLNLVDTLHNMGEASKKGSTRNFISSFVDGVLKSNEISVLADKRVDLLSQNFLKDVRTRNILIVRKVDSLFEQLEARFGIILTDVDDSVEDTIQFKITKVNPLQYRNPQSANIEQLWGQIYAMPVNKEIQNILQEKGIYFLYISFCVEDPTNTGYVTWLDRSYQYIPGIKQQLKSFELDGDNLRIEENTRINQQMVVNWFKKEIVDNGVFRTKEFLHLLNIFAGSAIANAPYRRSNNMINEIYQEFRTYFNNLIDNVKEISIPELSIEDIKKYFKTFDTDETLTIEVRQLLDDFILNGPQNSSQI